jgi:hypothetical protein
MSRGMGGALGFLALASAAGGCVVDPPVISPKFQALAPVRIAVLPVENATLVDLTRVTTAGLLQGLISKREINIPEAMQRGMVEALEKKGYATEWISSSALVDFHAPIKGPPPAYDGALVCQITSWRLDSPGGEASISMGGSAELVRVGDAEHSGGESLFQANFDYRTSTLNPGVRTSLDLEEEGQRAGMAAVRSLPRAPKPEKPRSASPSAADRSAPSTGSGSPPPVPLAQGPGAVPPGAWRDLLPSPSDVPAAPLLRGPGVPPARRP